ncbi:unnamed protein product [Paramecium sonneborni]|uniref:C2 tensin-type domain-containing protein n=1 Tax=Paramecium sonneborni TaxID=65129 RepID=A0A8S1REJ1_9CILI|nr:unnamed protein product [Paramecium sonneborni]
MKNYEYKGNELVLQLNLVIYGDILIKFFHCGSLRLKFMFRLAFNTCMIDESKIIIPIEMSNLLIGDVIRIKYLEFSIERNIESIN